MKISDGPKVYVVGEQFETEETDRFLKDEGIDWKGDPDSTACEHLVEEAGRLCYLSFSNPRPGGNKAYIKHLIEVGHGSVLEHAVFNFIFTGISRSLTHELVRHRAGMSYSQLSQRYVDEHDVEFVVPPAYQEEVAAYLKHPDYSCASSRGGGVWVAGRQLELDEYAYHVDYLMNGKFAGISDKTARRKKCREAARSVLPNATETKIFVTANCRALRHFIELRGSLGADAEIRRLALVVLRVMQDRSPAIFADYAILIDPDEGEYVTTEHGKV